jgi:hypothetical protein
MIRLKAALRMSDLEVGQTGANYFPLKNSVE